MSDKESKEEKPAKLITDEEIAYLYAAYVFAGEEAAARRRNSED